MDTLQKLLRRHHNVSGWPRNARGFGILNTIFFFVRSILQRVTLPKLIILLTIECLNYFKNIAHSIFINLHGWAAQAICTSSDMLVKYSLSQNLKQPKLLNNLMSYNVNFCCCCYGASLRPSLHCIFEIPRCTKWVRSLY